VESIPVVHYHNHNHNHNHNTKPTDRPPNQPPKYSTMKYFVENNQSLAGSNPLLDAYFANLSTTLKQRTQGGIEFLLVLDHAKLPSSNPMSLVGDEQQGGGEQEDDYFYDGDVDLTETNDDEDEAGRSMNGSFVFDSASSLPLNEQTSSIQDIGSASFSLLTPNGSNTLKQQQQQQQSWQRSPNSVVLLDVLSPRSARWSAESPSDAALRRRSSSRNSSVSSSSCSSLPPTHSSSSSPSNNNNNHNSKSSGGAAAAASSPSNSTNTTNNRRRRYHSSSSIGEMGGRTTSSGTDSMLSCPTRPPMTPQSVTTQSTSNSKALASRTTTLLTETVAPLAL
jgi:hypothetical protein